MENFLQIIILKIVQKLGKKIYEENVQKNCEKNYRENCEKLGKKAKLFGLLSDPYHKGIRWIYDRN